MSQSLRFDVQLVLEVAEACDDEALARFDRSFLLSCVAAYFRLALCGAII